MFKCGFNFYSTNKWREEGYIFFAKHRSRFILAALGCRFDEAFIGKSLMSECILQGVSSTYVTETALKICCLLAFGEDFPKNHFTYENLDHFLVKLRSRKAVRIIIQSGYRPRSKNLALLQHKGKITSSDVQEFCEKHPLPLTLERLAANVVRTSLQPNAVFGARKLAEAGEIIAEHQSFITLGITKENAHDMKNVII